MVAFQSHSVFFILTVTLLPLAMAVPQWFNGSDGRDYLIETAQTYNWYQSLHACARHNLQLVEIESGVKNLAVMSILKAQYGNSHNLWLGANDEYSEANTRSFYWTPSGQVMTYSYWNNGQPDNLNGEEHCVHTSAEAENFKWSDSACTLKMGYICEQK